MFRKIHRNPPHTPSCEVNNTHTQGQLCCFCEFRRLSSVSTCLVSTLPPRESVRILSSAIFSTSAAVLPSKKCSSTDLPSLAVSNVAPTSAGCSPTTPRLPWPSFSFHVRATLLFRRAWEWQRGEGGCVRTPSPRAPSVFLQQNQARTSKPVFEAESKSVLHSAG